MNEVGLGQESMGLQLNPQHQQTVARTMSTTSLLEAVAPEESPKEDKPRRPMNAFLLYSNDMRPILQAQHAGLSSSELGKMLGDGWKTLPQETKAKYVERANQVKEEFKAAHPDFVYKKKPKKPRELFTETGERVKRPVNAFLLYNREMRPKIQSENPTMHAQDMSRVIGEGWRTLSNEDRQKYIIEASRIKSDFERDYPDYVYTRSVKRKNVEEEKIEPPAELEQPLGGQQKKKHKKDANAPKHPMSAFFFFLRERREFLHEEFPTMPHSQISQKAAEDWAKMSNEEKEPYVQKSLEDKERYAQEKKEHQMNPPV